MNLNSVKCERGLGDNFNFPNNTQYQGQFMNQKHLFTNNTCSPTVGYQTYSNNKPFSKKPFGFKSKPPFRNFNQKPFSNNRFNRNNNPFLIIDLNQPWVTEEIKNEEKKKQELVDKWKVFSTDENWSEYQKQKQIVQSLYTNAKREFVQNHPDEAAERKNNFNRKSFFCETCDKSFKTDDDLLLHESEHETCGLEGCTFTAHPKIISKHIKMQHKTGLYKRIGQLYSQEDINKWIEDRKRRYPTAKVIEEKKALEKEKINRGEKIKKDESKFNESFIYKDSKGFRKKGDKKQQHENRKLHKRNKKTKKKVKPPVAQISYEEEIPSARKGVPAFSGINETVAIKEEPVDDLNISDDDYEVETKPVPAQPCISSSLKLLANIYNSDDEDEVVEVKIKEEKKPVVEISDDESGPEEVKTISSKTLEPEEVVEIAPCKRLNNKTNNNGRKKQKMECKECVPQLRRKTLLEKLLENEIRHERNVILQCINYVVKNKFFQ